MLTEAIVASVIAGSSVCSDHFENNSRFNPTELSDYQQCVLAAHSSDSAGTLGGIFWAKIGETEFVSMPVRKIRTAGSASAAKKVVGDAVREAMLKDMVDALTEDLLNANEEIIGLESRITTLEEARDALVESGVTQAAIDALDRQIEGLQRQVNAKIGWSSPAQVSAAASRAYGEGEVAGRRSGANNLVSTAAHAVSTHFINAHRDWSHWTAFFNDPATMTAQTELQTNGVSSYGARLLANAMVDYIMANASDNLLPNGYILNDLTTDSRIIAGSSGSNYVSVADRAESADAVNGTARDGSDIFTRINDITTRDGEALVTALDRDNQFDLVDIINDIFDNGFDKGYDEGYADGYRDGFSDGVSSVTGN